MASLPSSLDFKVTFDLPNGNLILTDNTDYTGVVGALDLTFSVLDPTDTLYQSTSTYPATPADIPIPLLVGGGVIPGEYEFTFKVANTDDIVETESTIKYTFTYVSPVVDVDMTVDCIYPLLESTDNTDYNVNGLNPTSITRSHVLQYPPATNEPDVTVATALLQTSTVYTLKDQPLQHSATVTSDLVYDPNANISIIDQVVGTGYLEVQCDNDLCDVYCSLKCKWNDYEKEKCKNKTLADKYLAEFIQMTSYSRMIESAMKCGKGEDISTFTQEISKLAGCDSCGCSDGDPILVTGLGVTIGGGGNIYNVVSGGAPIVVSSNTVGNTTTYTITLDAITVAKIDSLHNTVVSAGTNVTVSSVTALDGTVTYTVNSTVTANQDIMSFIITIDNSVINDVPGLIISDMTYSGSYFSGAPTIYWLSRPLSPAFSTVTPNPSFAEFTSEEVSIFLEDIFDTAPPKDPKIHIDVLRAYQNFANLTSATDLPFYKVEYPTIIPSVFYKNQELRIAFNNELTNNILDRTGKFFAKSLTNHPILTEPTNQGYYVQLSITMIL